MMRRSILSGLMASGAAAFSDSSPFLMYSTAKYDEPVLPFWNQISLPIWKTPNKKSISADSNASNSHRLDIPSPNTQLQSTEKVLQTAHDLLASCPTSVYLIHTQPNAHASDLRDPQTGRCSAPHLCGGDARQTAYGVAEVVGGEMSAAELSEYIETACAKAGREHSVSVTQLEALPREGAERGIVMQRAGMVYSRLSLCWTS